MKWRGDEETGRDKIGDILREVVVISDEENSDSEESDDEDESSDEDSIEDTDAALPSPLPGRIETGTRPEKWRARRRTRKCKTRQDGVSKPQGIGHPRLNPSCKRDKRGFSRYEAAQATRNQRWEEAITRSRRAQNPEVPLQAPMQRVPSQTVQRSPSVEIIPPVQRVNSMRDAHKRPDSQPFYDGRQWNGCLSRSNENPAANHYRQEPFIPHEARSASGFAPSNGVAVGRLVGTAPQNHPRNIPAVGRLHHGELKDFLVPSVEPISPHSRLDNPQYLRRVIHEEPYNAMRPEQVPVGPSRQYMVMQNRPTATGMAPHNHATDQPFRPAMVDEVRERIIPQFGSHYARDPQPHSAISPQEGQRVYYTREPIYDAPHHPPEPPMTSRARLVRVHRVARSMEMQAPEASRTREFSPRRLAANDHAAPSTARGFEARRYVVHREASASAFDAQTRVPMPGPARPLYYEVHHSAQPGPWQSSNPDARPHSPFLPLDPGRYYDSVARRPFHEATVPHSRAHVEYPGDRGRVDLFCPSTFPG